MPTDTPRPTAPMAPHSLSHIALARAAFDAVRGPVLLASDGDAPTDAAAVLARRVARRLATTLDVVAVLEPLPTYGLPYLVPYVPAALEAQRRVDLHDAVARRLEPVLGSRAEWRLNVEYGPLGRTIAEVARVHDAGLIVLGSGGHRVHDRMLGEDVAVQAVRHARCPVLAVAPDAAGPITCAVVGVDFGAPSTRAALAAAALIESMPDEPGRLVLVHVRSPFEHEYPTLGTWAREMDADVAARMTRLRAMLRPHVADGVTIETRSRVGAVASVVIEAADEVGAQLVAVGTHGPGWFERLFVGSVAEATVRHAARSVLVTPAPDPIDRLRLELGLDQLVDRVPPERWSAALDAFTRRNAGRPANLEVLDAPTARQRVHTVRYPLGGATYDVHDGRVQLMLGGVGDASAHVTHTIPHVRAIEILARPDGASDELLVVRGAGGHAALSFLDGDRAPVS